MKLILCKCGKTFPPRKQRKICVYCDVKQAVKNGISFAPAQVRAIQLVNQAVAHGVLSHVKSHTCVDCGKPAQCYDHRDYFKPLDVEPVCNNCNKKRGPALNDIRLKNVEPLGCRS